MSDISAITLAGMRQDMARLERIGVNLANVLTPAYKREVVIAPGSVGLANFGETLESMRSDSLSSKPSGEILPATALRRIETPGVVKRTGHALDVAILGDGYFEIGTDSGPAYTRQGQFHVDAHGKLVNAQGLAVMGLDGEIDVSDADVRIDDTGRIFDGNSSDAQRRPVAQIKVVAFLPDVALARSGAGLVHAVDASVPAVADVGKNESRSLMQGYLEASNVEPMVEMVDLIATMRHFEAMQKIAVGHDDMLSVAIRKLGEIS